MTDVTERVHTALLLSELIWETFREKTTISRKRDVIHEM